MAGRLVFHPEDATHSGKMVFDIGTFPKETRDERPRKVSDERLVYRDDGRLAVPAGWDYPEGDEHLMMPETEYLAQRDGRKR